MITTSDAVALVLDSWPILEWVKNREPACSKFSRIVEAAHRGSVTLHMSRINFGETVYSIHKGFSESDAASQLLVLRSLPIKLHGVDDALVDEATALKSTYAISYADAFGVALAIRLKLPFVSGDRELRAVRGDQFQLLWVGA